jgi:hypothetical protein
VKIAKLTVAQTAQLARIPTSTDGYCRYAPCEVTLVTGEVRDCVYVVEQESYMRMWGVAPTDDPGKRSVLIEDVVEIRESPSRLRADLANKLYEAGESGMGYVIFTVVMKDGSRLPFVTGNAVDFPAWPPGSSAAQAVEVLPHVGRDVFRDRGPSEYERSAEYAWCLYAR